MKILLTTSYVTLFVMFLIGCASASAGDYKASFQLENTSSKQGVRLVESLDNQIDVTYRVAETKQDSILFRIYITNRSSRPISISNSLFSIQSIDSKKIYTAEEPGILSSRHDHEFYLKKTILTPGVSTSGRIRFKVKNSQGKWILKSKLSSNAFRFDVAKNTSRHSASSN